MAILDRETYKKMEYYLYNYFEIKKEVQDHKEDIVNAGRREIDISGSGRSYHADTTAMKALKLVAPEMQKKEKWLEIIEKTLKQYDGTDKGKLLEKKYFDELGELHICNELYISRATYYNWREEILLYMTLLAVQNKLINVNSITREEKTG